MNRLGWLRGLTAVVVAVGLVGCASMPPQRSIAMKPVQPGEGEMVDVNQVIILGDVSGSMNHTSKYPLEKAILETLVSAMPDGKYEAGINSFGGYADSRWLRNRTQAFDRAALTGQAQAFRYLGGATLLGQAMQGLEWDVVRRGGKTALIILSDGRSDSLPALQAAQNLLYLHQGELCIHTVQFGEHPKGGALLAALANSADCGSSYHARDLTTADGIAAFVRDVFFGPAPVKPKPEPVAEVKDSDGDGVPDDQDKCPNTPKGAKVDERGCWVLENVQFDFDKAVIKPQYQPIIDEAAEVLKKNPEVKVRVDGHTDSDGPEAYNQKLSERRATAVRQALIGKGIAAERITMKGFGESQPRVPNTTPENKYKNRRVELTPTAQ